MHVALRTVVVATATALTLVAGPAASSQATEVRPATAAESLRVATFNIQKAQGSKRSWKKRRVALVRTVNDTRPDVLLIQEASTKKWHGVRHIDDVVRVLGGAGYRIASTDYDSCTAGCTRGAHVFFDPARVQLIAPPTGIPAAGMAGLSTIAGVSFGGIQDRNASWAFLRPVGSGRTTLYVSVHLPTEKSAFAESLRLAVARALRPWAEGLIRASGMAGVELVIGGDFNSYQVRQPYGAQQVLGGVGLLDAYAAPVKVNPYFGTINYTKKTRKYKGFPPRPYFYRNIPPTRIDYVFATVPAQVHEVVVFLTRSGKFRNKFRASDHNMVMVTLPLR